MKKFFSVLLVIIGGLLVTGQAMVYSTNGVLPPLHDAPTFSTTVLRNLGSFMGHNTFGIIGVLMLLFGFKGFRKESE